MSKPIESAINNNDDITILTPQELDNITGGYDFEGHCDDSHDKSQNHGKSHTKCHGHGRSDHDHDHDHERGGSRR